LALECGQCPPTERVHESLARLTGIECEKIIERPPPTIGDRTHGVMVDDSFYYIANSGWDIVDDHGNVQPGTEPSAPRVMRVSQELALAKPRSRE